MPTEDMVRAILRVVEAFNEHDIEFLRHSVTDDFVRHDLAGALRSAGVGAVEVKSFLGALLAGIPDLRLEVQDMVPSTDRVTMRYCFSGTHTGTLLGIEATGRSVEFSGINIYRFAGDKIAEVWQLWDWAGMLHQIGVLDWPPHRPEGG